jgi:hypothetical protein
MKIPPRAGFFLPGLWYPSIDQVIRRMHTALDLNNEIAYYNYEHMLIMD